MRYIVIILYFLCLCVVLRAENYNAKVHLHLRLEKTTDGHYLYLLNGRSHDKKALMVTLKRFVEIDSGQLMDVSVGSNVEYGILDATLSELHKLGWLYIRLQGQLEGKLIDLRGGCITAGRFETELTECE